MSAPAGVLPIDKPAGPTSHDVVALARRALKIRRIGHTETLDPFASGLLLLCLGTATRLAEYLTALEKSYSATMRLGVETDTLDSQGQVVGTSDEWRSLGRREVVAALEGQAGDRLQIPPAFSAKRVGGERMYDVARRGGSVSLEPSPVRILRIEMTRFDPPEVDFEVDCSSGTYIRAIARDVGKDLATGAHLSALRRTRVGRFDVDGAISVDDLADPAAVRAALIPPADAVSHFARVELSPLETAAILHGRPVEHGGEPVAGPLALVSAEGDLIAIAEHVDGLLRPRKVFG